VVNIPTLLTTQIFHIYVAIGLVLKQTHTETHTERHTETHTPLVNLNIRINV